MTTRHPGLDGDLFVVRLYDGFDHIWMDVSKPVPKEEAERIWRERTDNGTKMTTFRDIDYYCVYPADTQMLYSAENASHRLPGLDGDEPQASYDAGTPAARYDHARLFHVGGAEVSLAPHAWAYRTDGEEDWQADGFFDGSRLRLGDWLMVSIYVGDRYHGAVRVVAQVAPHVALAQAVG